MKYILLVLLAFIVAPVSAHSQVTKGFAIGVNNLKETTKAYDPFVEKTNVAVSGLIENKFPGVVDVTYQGDITVHAGTHRDRHNKRHQLESRGNAILETTQAVYLSKTTGHFVPEIGVSGTAGIAALNSRQHYRIDGSIGMGYLTGNVKYGIRYQPNLYNRFVYDYATLSQNNVMGVTAYRETYVGKKVTGIAIGYQKSDVGDIVKKHQPNGYFGYYEPQSEKLLITLYRKF